jgi:hypothetical protein
MLTYLILSVLSGMGLAIILVEKRRQWPVRRYNLLIRVLLKKIHRRMPKMLSCTVCTAFWATLVCEIVILLFSFIFLNEFYWFWPLSGFIASGFTWIIMDFLISFANLASSEK